MARSALLTSAGIPYGSAQVGNGWGVAIDLAENGWPQPVEVAEVQLSDFERIRANYGDHLQPSLVLELDQLISGIRASRAFAAMAHGDPDGLRSSMGTLVVDVRDFAVAFGKHCGSLDLDPEYRSLIEGTREEALMTHRSEE
jgi:hypothetical protein